MAVVPIKSDYNAPMKILRLLVFCCTVVLFSGCAAKPPNQTVLLEVDPGKHLLGIAIERWEGWGPEGYAGYHSSSYWAALEGDGPIFVNPRLVGGAGDRCIGTITLDKEHNDVTINMMRIVSAPGGPLRTTPHPANGTHKIDLVRKATSYEKWF